MFESGETQRVSAVVRALATASKSLRLYPESSSIPREAVEAATSALERYFDGGDPVLALVVARDGFCWRGDPLNVGVLGVGDLVTELQDHGVAELHFLPGASTDELLGFLKALALTPEEVRAGGGPGAVLASLGVDRVRVADVLLTVVEQICPSPDEDPDEFLRGLVGDPERLAAWFATAASGDSRTFEEGLMELLRVAGPSGYGQLLDSLSQAFVAQKFDARDALLDLAMDPGPSRDLTGQMFGLLGSEDIAGSVLGGTFGKNMLSLSRALSNLPLEHVTQQVRAEVQAMLPGLGHSSDEAEFLGHMLEIREAEAPEPALIDLDATYQTVADVAQLPDDMVDRARSAVAESTTKMSAIGVRTMLTLLEQQSSAALVCETAASLAAMTPQLIEQGEVALASHVVDELASRSEGDLYDRMPELPAKMREACTDAAGPRSMRALVRAVIADRADADIGRSILTHGGEAGARALAAEAVTLKAEGLEVAELLIGRRFVDVLREVAPQAQWFQLAPVVARLAADGSDRSWQTIDALSSRADKQSRREVIAGAALAGGAATLRYCGAALRDKDPEVAITAARLLGRSGQADATPLISQRLNELDMDSADYAVAREMIAALGFLPGSEADQTLARIAGRRSLIKRQHFGEVQSLVRQMQQVRAQAGVTR